MSAGIIFLKSKICVLLDQDRSKSEGETVDRCADL